jgi:hypothetical protein
MSVYSYSGILPMLIQALIDSVRVGGQLQAQIGIGTTTSAISYTSASIKVLDTGSSCTSTVCPFALFVQGQPLQSTGLLMPTSSAKYIGIKLNNYQFIMGITYGTNYSNYFAATQATDVLRLAYAELIGDGVSMPFTITDTNANQVSVYFGYPKCVAGSDTYDGSLNPVEALAKYAAYYGTIPYKQVTFIGAYSTVAGDKCLSYSNISPLYTYTTTSSGLLTLRVGINDNIMIKLVYDMLGTLNPGPNDYIDLYSLAYGKYVGANSVQLDWGMIFQPKFTITSNVMQKVLSSSYLLNFNFKLASTTYSSVAIA